MQTLDATGLACPMPIVKTKKAMDQLQAGELLEVLVTDKGAVNDFAAWCQASGNTLVAQTEDEDVLTFRVQKG